MRAGYRAAEGMAAGLVAALEIDGRDKVGVRIIQGESISGGFHGKQGRRDAREVNVIATCPEDQTAGAEYRCHGMGPACHDSLQNTSPRRNSFGLSSKGSKRDRCPVCREGAGASPEASFRTAKRCAKATEVGTPTSEPVQRPTAGEQLSGLRGTSACTNANPPNHKRPKRRVQEGKGVVGEIFGKARPLNRISTPSG